MDPAAFADLIARLGPTGILAAWLWFERRERVRLQELLERYLAPAMENTLRLARGVNRVIGDGGEQGGNNG